MLSYNSRMVFHVWKFTRGLILLFIFMLIGTVNQVRSAGVWGSRPLLSYFVLTPSLETQFRRGITLSPREYQQVERISEREFDQLRQNFQSSQRIIERPELSTEAKRHLIERMGYNREVERIVYQSDRQLRETLPSASYNRLVSWIEGRWSDEVALHGKPTVKNLSSNQSAVRSYEIFATRYTSKGGAYVVALPDQCVKFANGGLHTCDSKGYVAGSGYSVAISYKKGVGVLVGEAGPWNIDDNYWATIRDPQPRRMFVDLAAGMPEAQAAFFNGYNGGKDQYGRKVTAPFAIDLAFKVADDIGLPPKKNDWITVSFLWTADWEGKKAGTGKQIGGTPGVTPELTLASIPMIQTVTPAPDGSITHIVKAGETLWAVAMAYHVRVVEIQFLNNMGQTVIIYEGQKLKIKEAGPTWTPIAGEGTETQSTAAPEISTVSAVPTSGTLTSSPVTITSTDSVAKLETETAKTTEFSQTPRPSASTTIENPTARQGPKSSNFSDGDGLVIIALAIVVIGLVLFLLGLLFGKTKDSDDIE